MAGAELLLPIPEGLFLCKHHPEGASEQQEPARLVWALAQVLWAAKQGIAAAPGSALLAQGCSWNHSHAHLAQSSFAQALLEPP